MARPARTTPTSEQTDPADTSRRVDPGKVIDKLTQQVGALTQELAVAGVLIDDLTEENTGLRAELVTATGGERPAA